MVFKSDKAKICRVNLCGRERCRAILYINLFVILCSASLAFTKRTQTHSVDGVHWGTLTKGLLRVLHIDSHGLFASSNPMHICIGGIVLTVNGTRVTNGRAALDKVMGSHHLIKILHCNE